MESPFSSQIFILLFTAIVSGLMVPSVLKLIDWKLEKQKKARDQQLDFAGKLSKSVWEWRFLAKQVCYYGASYTKSDADRQRFDQAVSALRTAGMDGIDGNTVAANNKYPVVSDACGGNDCQAIRLH